MGRVVEGLGRGGYAAVSREIGLTPEAVRRRVLRILGPP
jgi:hypothetical protein